MSDAAADGGGPGMRRTFIVPTVASFDHYDFTRAKIKCSLTWLVAKAFGSGKVAPGRVFTPALHDQGNVSHHWRIPVSLQ